MADRPESAGKAGDNRPSLSLHVPEPKFRPGDAVDFSHIEVPPAGAQPRPDETADPKDLRDFAFGLIRVLGEDNKAHGPWDPKLDPETLRKMLGHMAMSIGLPATSQITVIAMDAMPSASSPSVINGPLLSIAKMTISPRVAS